MIKVRDVIEVMEHWAPSSLAENWDNVGLITGDTEKNVTSITITLDVTEKTIATALKNKTSLIIAHHPPLFRPLKNLTGTDISSSVIRTAVREDISIYASHTNLDQAPGGVSWALAQKLDLVSVSPLSADTSGLVKFVTFIPPEYTDRVREAAGAKGAGIIGEYRLCSFTSKGIGTYIPSASSAPYEGEPDTLSRVDEDRLEMIVPASRAPWVVEAARKAHPYEEMAYDLIPLSNRDRSSGYGAVGNLEEPMKPSRFPEYVAEVLGVETLNISKGNKKLIKRVAAMGGSGRNYISCAVTAGADAYVTGDLGYHDFMEYRQSILLIDASHRATELPVLDKIKKRLLTAGWSEPVDIIIDKGENNPTIYTGKPVS